MYYIQKRKSANSQWHTAKDQRGRKLSTNSISHISDMVLSYSDVLKGCDIRVVDNATGDVVSI